MSSPASRLTFSCGVSACSSMTARVSGLSDVSHHGCAPQRPVAWAAAGSSITPAASRPSTPLRTGGNLEIEERGRAGCPGAQRILDVALHPRGDRLGAPVGVEALHVEPQLL